MSEQEPIQTATQPKPVPEGYSTWNEYWTKAHKQSWRTEPEIDAERRYFLAERRAVRVDIEKGIYPFRDENGSIKLNRADVEWLLATHERQDGSLGPEEYSNDVSDTQRGLDVRGADLQCVNLRKLPLTRLYAGLVAEEREKTTPAQWDLAAGLMQECDLFGADLRLSCLAGTHLEGADLTRARAEEVFLGFAHLEGCKLLEASFDRAALPGAHLNGVLFDQVVLGHINLAVVDWRTVRILGDERIARTVRNASGKRKNRRTRIDECEAAVRANHQLAAELRSQGLNEYADMFAYHAQVLQRRLLRYQRHYVIAFSSWLLDIIAGYGYLPSRSLITYFVVNALFASVYLFVSHFVTEPAGGISLGVPEAIIFSVTSFHGRGFSPGPGGEHVALSNPIVMVSAVEAGVGLLLEITFFATVTQRFLSR